MDRPAWSEQFERLRPVRPLDPALTRDWAWGGSTGRGVQHPGLAPFHVKTVLRATADNA